MKRVRVCKIPDGPNSENVGIFLYNGQEVIGKWDLRKKNVFYQVTVFGDVTARPAREFKFKF